MSIMLPGRKTYFGSAVSAKLIAHRFILRARIAVLSTLNKRRVRKTLPPQIALSLTILMWGCSFVAAKVALREISPVTLTFIRFGLGTALLLLVVALQGANPFPPRDTWLPLALMGFVGV